jgi:hypothetical protein
MRDLSSFLGVFELTRNVGHIELSSFPALLRAGKLEKWGGRKSRKVACSVASVCAWPWLTLLILSNEIRKGLK